MPYLYHNISLNVNIANALEFTVCNAIKINKSVKELAGTATLTLPREFRNAVDSTGQTININGRSILDFIHRGDRITIGLGYDGDVQPEFVGYVTSISADVPLILECEDEMFRLKQGERISKHITSGSLKDVLKAILPAEYSLDINEEYNIGPWLIENATPYEVLDELKQQTGLSFYFIDEKTLKVGLPIDLKPEVTHTFNFSENIRKGNTLKFREKSDRKIEVTVNSKQPDGKENTATVGEKGGDTQTINFPRLTKAQCKEWAKKVYASKSYSGFEGSFAGWCYPRTLPGDTTKIVRPYYEDRHQDGEYFIEAVEINVNESVGIERKNSISYKL